MKNLDNAIIQKNRMIKHYRDLIQKDERNLNVLTKLEGEESSVKNTKWNIEHSREMLIIEIDSLEALEFYKENQLQLA